MLAVRERYGVERDESLQLRDFPTLNHVAAWVRHRAGLDAPTSAAVSTDALPATPAAGAPAAPEVVHGDFDAVDALPRRVPVPSLRPDADDVRAYWCRTRRSPSRGDARPRRRRRRPPKQLAKAGATPLALSPGVATDDLLATLAAWHEEAPITGVYWLAALDADGDLAEYDLERLARERCAGGSRRCTRRCATCTTPARSSSSATRLGGYHGYDDAGATNPLGGPVVGFTKSYKKERPDATVKAVDLAESRKTHSGRRATDRGDAARSPAASRSGVSTVAGSAWRSSNRPSRSESAMNAPAGQPPGARRGR